MAIGQPTISLWDIYVADSAHSDEMLAKYAKQLLDFASTAKVGEELVFFDDKETAKNCGFGITGSIYGHKGSFRGDSVRGKDDTHVSTSAVMSVTRVKDDTNCNFGVTFKIKTINSTYYAHACEGWDLRQKARRYR